MPGERGELEGEQEAAEISRRVQAGEAQNEQEARAEMALETNPRAFLENFVQTPITTKIRHDWRPGLADYIKSRLDNAPPG